MYNPITDYNKMKTTLMQERPSKDAPRREKASYQRLKHIVYGMHQQLFTLTADPRFVPNCKGDESVMIALRELNLKDNTAKYPQATVYLTKDKIGGKYDQYLHQFHKGDWVSIEYRINQKGYYTVKGIYHRNPPRINIPADCLIDGKY